MKDLYELDGREFTLIELSIVSGISYKTLVKRFRSGDRPERAVRNAAYKDTKIYSFGEELVNIQELSRMSRVSIEVLRKRFKSGWNVAKAIGPVLADKRKVVKYMGNYYSPSEIARISDNKLSHTTDPEHPGLYLVK